MPFAIAAALALLAPPASGQTVDIAGPPAAWAANVDRGASTVTVGSSTEALLIATVRTDGDGQEDFPKIVRAFEPAEDWAGYARLRFRVRLTCDDPDVRERPLSLVIYDRNTLREDLPDHPMTQQVVPYSVPVGEWVDLDHWLLDIHRTAVPMVALYLYEQPGGRATEYRWEFASISLEGFGEEAVVFDMEPFAETDLRVAANPLVGRVEAADGLSLTIDEAGAIGEVRLDGDRIAKPEGRPTGLLARDVAAGGRPVPLGGRVTASGGAIRQVGGDDRLGLAVDATYRADGDRIEVAGVLRDTRGEDRAVTLYLAIPVGQADWRWWDGAAKSRSRAEAAQGSLGELGYLESGMAYGQNGMHSRYPIGAISEPATGGLTLGVRMDEPVVHRIQYNPGLGLLYLALDLGLVPEKTVEGRSLSEVPFRAILYRHDPAWGFRAALERYYGFYPDFFVKRAPSEGGWYVWGNVADTEGALEAGFGFHWGPIGDEAVRWDNAHGILSVLYIEPELFQLTTGDLDRAPTREEALGRLERLAAGDPEEMAAFRKLSYSGSYVPGPWVAKHTPEEAIQVIARAALASVTHRDGEPELSAGQYPWMGESQWGMMFPCDLDPEIPGGKGQFAREVYIEPALEAADEAGAHYDGVALDSFGGFGNFARADDRREHFRYADSPLSFSATSHKPVLVTAFSSLEWLRELAADTHADGRILMANCSWYLTPGWLTFAAPYLDVFGAEATQFADPDFIRAIARTKPCTDLPYSPRPEWEVPWHMLHAIHPGHGNDLAAMARLRPALVELVRAGWEPITHARALPESVQVERYGSGDGLYLVAHNAGDLAVDATLTLDLPALGLEAIGSAEAYFGEPVSAVGNRLTLPLEAKGTVAIRVRGG